MQTTKKKPSLIFILVGAMLAGYLGYLINGAWTEGIAFNEFMDRFNEVCAVPFANYYNSNTVKAVAILTERSSKCYRIGTGNVIYCAYVKKNVFYKSQFLYKGEY